MNCQDFQNQIHEYVEGSFPAGEKAAAESHLAQCATCRALVHREQQAGVLFGGTAVNLTLRPEIRRRILSAVQGESTPVQSNLGWNRFAWPLVLAASVIMAAGFLWFVHAKNLRSQSAGNPTVVLIEVSYCEPIHQSRMEGERIVDEVSMETVVISESLPATACSGEKPKQKITL